MTWLTLLLAGLVAPIAPPADAPSPCQVRVILFVPADVEPPATHQRVREFADYAEAFFLGGLARWGHKEVVKPFRRAADGQVEVTVMRGKKKTADYEPVPLRAEVMDELRRQNKLEGGWQVWWIMVYAGEPPARYEGFLGGVGPQIGGWALCNLDTSPGRIDPAQPLGSELLAKLMLKGMMHELGHGLGLGHIGPLDGDDAGNTVMGPTHINFRRVRGEAEERVYLSEAEAAILAMHPAFRGIPDERGRLPQPQVRDLKCDASPGNRTIRVRGRVESAIRPVYAVVGDESEDRPGEYWTKTYVGKVAVDGSFTVIISEPAQSAGTLKTWFVFDDGEQTGDGKKRGRPGGIPTPYTWSRGTWKFE